MKKDTSSPKVVLITGASSGIGRSIAEFLNQRAYLVYGTSRNPDRVRDCSFPLLALDVTSRESIETAVGRVMEEKGRIDILINNAGVGITGPIEETPDEEIQKAFDTNYFGPLKMIKAVLPTMRERRSGLIINITSIAGYMGLPYRGIYSASKGALELTTEAYRMELKDFNVQMTNVAPGDFATNIAAGRYHAPVLEGSPYKVPYGATLAVMNKHVDSGQDPDLMGRAIYRIIEKEEPKGHYQVGEFLQKISIRLKALLPDKVYEKMLLKHYKL